MPRCHHPAGEVQLSYSTNLHPARDLEEVSRYLCRETAQVRRELALPGPLGVCLHLPPRAIRQLQAPGAAGRLRELLDQQALEVVGINGFPLGDFHATAVKEAVYAPDWTTAERVELTVALARILVTLLPGDQSATISTLAGGARPITRDPDARRACARNLVEVAQELARLGERHGTRLLLGLEPEPCTTLETSEEVVEFFRADLESAGRELGVPAERWRAHLGLNLDLCHQAVLFEDLPGVLDRLPQEGIRLGSVHAAAALRVAPVTLEGLERLQAFVEPRWLHQVAGVDEAGKVRLRVSDLTRLTDHAPGELLELAELRCHFHVPLDAPTVAGLPTTAPLTAAALRHLVEGGACPQVVAETYTWGTGPLTATSLPAAIAGELRWLMEQAGLSPAPASGTRE